MTKRTTDVQVNESAIAAAKVRHAFIAASEEIKLHLIQAHLSALVPLEIGELQRQGGPTELQFDRARGLDETSNKRQTETSTPAIFESLGVPPPSSETVEAYYAPFRGNNPLAAGGDSFLFGGKSGEASDYMGKLTQVLAVLAFQPGGVTAFGLHFEATADGYPAERGKQP